MRRAADGAGPRSGSVDVEDSLTHPVPSPKGKVKHVSDRFMRAPRGDKRQTAACVRRARAVPPGLGRPVERVSLLLPGPAARAETDPGASPAGNADRADRPA